MSYYNPHLYLSLVRLNVPFENKYERQRWFCEDPLENISDAGTHDKMEHRSATQNKSDEINF